MELSKSVIKFVIGVILTITGYILSNDLYFAQTPLFGIPYFGQTLIGFALGAFGVMVLPSLAFTTVSWVESVISKTVVQLWDQQAKKIQESKRRKEEKEEEELLGEAVVLDTSAIIDGRILDVIKTGFLDNPLIVPGAVIGELQMLSDSSDDLKRQRGRLGLDILKEMKKHAKVVIWEKDEAGKKNGEVDKLIVKLAKELKASIATVDFNLNKVASLSGIKVLNVNELSNAIKAVVLPGENLQVKVVQGGKEQTQGVGYLNDGTMIVVEQGVDLIGKEASVLVSRVIQTPAGKIIFAKKG